MPQTRLKERLYQIRPLRLVTQAALLRGTPNCVFIWVPKTAGTSLYHWLCNSIGMRKMNVPRDFSAFPGYGAVTFGHVHYLSLLYQGTISQAFHRSAYRFALVRDPYSRIVSLYNYLIVDQAYQGEFATFLEEVRLHRPPVGLYNHRGLSQTNPQVDWLMGWDGKLIADDVFKVEEMSAGIDSLSKRFSIQSPQLTSRNVSRKIITPSELNRDCIEQINEIYSRDFDVLNYARK